MNAPKMQRKKNEELCKKEQKKSEYMFRVLWSYFTNKKISYGNEVFTTTKVVRECFHVICLGLQSVTDLYDGYESWERIITKLALFCFWLNYYCLYRATSLIT